MSCGRYVLVGMVGVVVRTGVFASRKVYLHACLHIYLAVQFTLVYLFAFNIYVVLKFYL